MLPRPGERYKEAVYYLSGEDQESWGIDTFLTMILSLLAKITVDLKHPMK